MEHREPIILVDNSNICYRSHFAHQRLAFEGQPTGTYHGLLQAIRSLRKVSPRMIFCWDYGVPTDAPLPDHARCWRSAVFPDYKANRKSTPDHAIVRAQMPSIYKMLELIGYSSVGVPGLEADDVISCLAHELAGVGEQILIHSSDKDLYQILSPCRRIQVLLPGKKAGKYRTVNADDVEKEFGLSIAQWPTYLAVGGDSADNIKPMRGMGPKTATHIVKDGIQPDKPFKNQYITFRMQYHHLEPVWTRIQAAFQVALLPRNWQDPRISGYVNGTLPTYNRCQHWSSDHVKNSCKDQFMRFCAQHGLLQMLAVRREFFI